jgi:hypothetical protein
MLAVDNWGDRTLLVPSMPYAKDSYDTLVLHALLLSLTHSTTMNITREQATSYFMDVKGYDALQIQEIFQEIRESGTPLQQYMTSEDIAECEAFSA